MVNGLFVPKTSHFLHNYTPRLNPNFFFRDKPTKFSLTACVSITHLRITKLARKGLGNEESWMVII